MNIDAQKEIATNREQIRAEIIDFLNSYGLSAQIDVLLIDALARELEEYHTCMNVIKQEGSVRKFANGKQELMQIHPARKAAKLALDNALKLAKEFGLTTKSRLLLAAHKVDGNSFDAGYVDPLAELLKGRPKF
jgi:P27 family predicted phage terminase small subunit